MPTETAPNISGSASAAAPARYRLTRAVESMSRTRRAILPAMPKHDILTVSLSEAAAALHLSEKTVRRRIKAGELTATKEALDGGGIGWRVQIGTMLNNGVDIVPEVETDTRRNRDGQSDGQRHAQTVSAMDVQDIEVDKSVDAKNPTIIPFEFSENPRKSDHDDAVTTDFRAKYIAQIEEENRFLKLQLEAAMQSESQTKAALRELARAMPKQLTQGTPPEAATPPEPSGALQIASANNVPSATSNAVKSPQKRAPKPLWKLLLGIK